MDYRRFLDQSNYTLLPERSPRDYQQDIIHLSKEEIKDIIRSGRHKAVEGDKPPHLPTLTSLLIESATGSGKTFTAGTLIGDLWKYKNRFNAIKGGRESANAVFPDFNILVLNDRIGLVEQLRIELVDGSVNHHDQTIKRSIFPDEMVDNMCVATYHSAVEDVADVSSIQTDTSVDVDILNRDAKESMHFSTLHTAKLDQTREQIGKPNIILIDEADIVTMKAGGEYGEYLETLMSYYQPDDEGYYPLVIPITATPDNITKNIFGESVARFGLGEYLASGHGPKVHMYFETPPGVDASAIQDVMDEIQIAKSMTHHIEKKEKIKEIKEHIQQMLPERNSDSAKRAYLDRAISSIWDKITPNQKTLIFNNLITESNYTAAKINRLVGRDIAIARHSETSEEIAATLQGLKDGSRPIITSVGQLIRSIDIPALDNVFSLVNTSSAKKYLQLFGRGARGEQVNFYDYGGSFENMAFLASIYNEYITARQVREQSPIASERESLDEDLTIFIDGVMYDGSMTHDINLFAMIREYGALEFPEVDSVAVRTRFTRNGETLDHYNTMSQKQRIALKNELQAAFGLGPTTLPKLYTITGDFVKNTDVRYDTLEQIFETKIERAKEATPTTVRTRFTRNGETLDHYKTMSTKDKIALKNELQTAFGLGSTTLPKLYHITGDFLKNTDVRYDTLEQIFETKIERAKEATPTTVRTRFTRNGETLDHYNTMSQKQRIALKNELQAAFGLGSTTLPKLYMISGDFVGSTDVRYDTLEQIFETTIERATPTTVRTRFTRNDETLDHYKTMSTKDKIALKNELQAAFGLGSKALPKLYHITGDFVKNTDVRYDTLEQIFETRIDRN